MPQNGILGDNEGFVILVEGVPRTFRDVKAYAFDAALVLKKKNKCAIVEIVDRSTGEKFMMLEDGRTV